MKLKTNTFRIMLCACAGLFAAPLMAQWQAYTPALSDTVGTYDLRIAQNNDQVAWAVAMKYSVTTDEYVWQEMDSLVFFRTSDGGNTWQGGRLPMGPYPYASNICPISADTAWAAGVDADFVSYIMHTTDGGQNWQRQFENGYSKPSSYINFVHFWDAQNGLAMGDPAASDTSLAEYFEIYTTTDGGLNWSRVSSDSIPGPLSGEYSYAGDYFVVGDNVWFTTFNSATGAWRRVFRSNNRGRSWKAATALGGFLSFADASHGVIHTRTGNNAIIRYTSNGGATWTILPSIPNKFISSLVLIPGSNYLLCVWRDDNISGPFQTMISTDLGQNWMEIGDGSEHAGNAKFRSPAVGYAGEWQPAFHATRMYKYAGNPLTGLFSGQNLEANISLSPNPASDILRVTIEAEIPESYILMIHDSRGMLAHKRVLDASANTRVQVGLEGLAPGAYTLTLSSTRGYATRKFIKL